MACDATLNFDAQVKSLDRASYLIRKDEADINALTEQLKTLQTEYLKLIKQGSCAAYIGLANIYFYMWDSEAEQAMLMSNYDASKLDLTKALQYSQQASQQGDYEATLLMAQIYVQQAPLADSNVAKLTLTEQAHATAQFSLQQLHSTVLPPKDDEAEKIQTFITGLADNITLL